MVQFGPVEPEAGVRFSPRALNNQEVKMDLIRAKGTKELMPEEKIKIVRIMNLIKKTFEKYGFSPMDTPIIQRYDVLASKYAGGAEILKETFKLKDQGNRELALRYDLTVPMAIAIALNQNIKLPLKRYEIGRVYRDGPVEKARVREFYQCDADVIGSKSLVSDAELLKIYKEVFDELKIKVEIKVNSIKLLNEIIYYAGLSGKEEKAILIIDKLEKFGAEQVKKELKEIANEEQIKRLLNVLEIKGSNTEKIEKIKNILGNTVGINEIEELERYCKSMKVNFVFDVSLARGLSYYTGPVFEVFTKGERASLGGGGRYDEMVGNLIGKGEYPATGISFGLYRIMQLMKDDGTKTVTKVYIIHIKKLEKSLTLTNYIRDSGINADIDTNERAISKNLDYASKLGIPYVIFVGENEIKAKKFKLRNMKTGKEEMLKKEDIIKKLK